LRSIEASLGSLAREAGMRYDRQIIGYHACAQPIAERLLQGEPFRPSTNDWDWLGHGVYFWEYGFRHGLPRSATKDDDRDHAPALASPRHR
jgi:hypothetical protein